MKFVKIYKIWENIGKIRETKSSILAVKPNLSEAGVQKK